MLVAYDLEKSSTRSQEKINALANWALEQEMQFICLTATLQTGSEAFREKYNAPYEFFISDEITLKTIIRSNPGLVVIKGGTIVAKYHYNDIPTPEEFQQKIINK